MKTQIFLQIPEIKFQINCVWPNHHFPSPQEPAMTTRQAPTTRLARAGRKAVTRTVCVWTGMPTTLSVWMCECSTLQLATKLTYVLTDTVSKPWHTFYWSLGKWLVEDVWVMGTSNNKKLTPNYTLSTQTPNYVLLYLGTGNLGYQNVFLWPLKYNFQITIDAKSCHENKYLSLKYILQKIVFPASSNIKNMNRKNLIL